MRPWPVFLAQVLQFQDQLAASRMSEGPAAGRRELPDGPLRRAQAALDEFRKAGRKSQILIDVGNALEGVLPSAPPEAATLRELGFGELPPAGFLPAAPQERRQDLQGHYATLLGSAVAVRICHCRADHVPLAIEQAQHLDRIPLAGADGATAVDVLVPDLPTDLPALRPGGGDHAYGWVAFVRRSGARCEWPTDDVDVYLLTFGGKIEDLTDPGHKLGTLSYPKDAWEYPGGDVVEELLGQPEWTAEKDNGPVRLVAVTQDDARRPLAALRATLFAASIDAGIAAPAVFARQQPDVAGEAIVVVLSPAGLR